MVTILNSGSEALRADIPVWEIEVKENGTMRRLMLTADDTYNSGQLDFPVKDGILSVEMPPESSMVFAEVTEEEE